MKTEEPTASVRELGPELDGDASVGPGIRREPGLAESDPRRFQSRRRRTEFALAWLAPVILFVSWEAAAQRGTINRRFFPPPTELWSAGTELISSGALQEDLWVTVKRVLIGFFLGSGIGIALGLILGTWWVMRAAFGPILSGLYTVPKLALLPLFLLIFGVGETSKIAVIVVTVFFFMWISTQEAILAVPASYREAARSFGANSLQMFWHVVIPAALPGMFVGLQLSAGVSVLVVIGIEFVQGGNGIGHLIWFSWSLFRPDRMYVGIIVAGVMGMAFTGLVRVAAKRLLPWTSQEGRAGGVM